MEYYTESKGEIIKQFFLSPAAGKRLIAKSILHIPAIANAIENATVVVIAGTTNGYVVEEIFKKKKQKNEFSKNRFFRGVSLPAGYKMTKAGRLPDESEFPGDVVIEKGVWNKGKTITDVVDDLKEGDIIIKGANAINLKTRQAAVYIGHPKGGTVLVALQAAIGRRVEIFIPVGLEKRIDGDINDIAVRLNSANAKGYRYMPLSGNTVTEIDAVKILTGAKAELVAGGGTGGAEGHFWIAVSGEENQMEKAEKILKEVMSEPDFVL